ncbi:MAG: hypothetical protein J6I53_05855 [Treponema sp.]|uniref:hypothetical protein n=1 Tax=Treponema sp. TaxID=166 RepID=UPI001B70A705|nr:hypothetical protein [Treponema sp.]MBP3772201.1 hypothetical protein [Treponema sp.]MBQ9281943.1 hypothetical protein [Treponema sp.]
MNRININKILIALIAGIIVFITAVSAIALCTKNAHPGEGLRHEDPDPSSVPATKTAFNNIGQIRVFTKEDPAGQKSVLVLVPWLEYDGTDQAFYEELDRKHQSLKILLSNYFSAHTKTELLEIGEDKIKRELKSQVNESLVLGEITGIYFNDYLFLD